MVEIVSETTVGNVTDYVILTESSDTVIETPIKNFTINPGTTYYNVKEATTELINTLSTDTYSDTKLTTEILLSEKTKSNKVPEDTEFSLDLYFPTDINKTTCFVREEPISTIILQYAAANEFKGGYFEIPDQYRSQLAICLLRKPNTFYLKFFFTINFQGSYIIYNNVYFYFKVGNIEYKMPLSLRVTRG